jgi:hypothetical protein
VRSAFLGRGDRFFGEVRSAFLGRGDRFFGEVRSAFLEMGDRLLAGKFVEIRSSQLNKCDRLRYNQFSYQHNFNHGRMGWRKS